MMETSSPNKTVVEELIRGRESTKKLRNLLRRKTSEDDGSPSAEDLVMKILGSFSDSLSVLNSCNSGDSYPVTYAGSDCSGDRTLDSGESEKKPVVKDRRGCYKRRKTENSRVKIVNTIEDGYAWRKYGQKEILNAKFHRCYFRCTHKNEGCKALKQVQKLEDGSEMYHITYFGYHTCQNMHKNTTMFSDSGALTFFLHNFQDNKIKISPISPSTITTHSPSSPSTITNVHNTPLMEQEDDSNAQSGNHMETTNSNSLWNMMGDLESSHGVFLNNDDYLGSGFKLDDEIVFL